MKLSACTRLLKNLCDPFTDEPEILKEMGFAGMDFDLNYSVSEKLGENWRSAAEKFAERSREIGVTAVQTHLPYAYLKGVGPQGAEKRVMDEALEATKILGAPYAVFHAVSTPDAADGLAATYEYFMPVIEKARELGFEPLIEIMPDYVVYPNTAEYLVEAADKMEIGVCWDFGHFNINKPRGENDQTAALRLVGNRLKAVHVNDNFGTSTDEHLVPFMGTVDWKTNLPILREIGYDGEFNFEVLPFRVPKELMMSFGKHLALTGEYMIELIGR